MPYRKDVSIADLTLWDKFGKLKRSVEEIVERVRTGAKLEVEHSSMTDPGDDWSRLWLNEEEIGYMPGY